MLRNKNLLKRVTYSNSVLKSFFSKQENKIRVPGASRKCCTYSFGGIRVGLYWCCRWYLFISVKTRIHRTQFGDFHRCFDKRFLVTRIAYVLVSSQGRTVFSGFLSFKAIIILLILIDSLGSTLHLCSLVQRLNNNLMMFYVCRKNVIFCWSLFGWSWTRLISSSTEADDPCLWLYSYNWP